MGESVEAFYDDLADSYHLMFENWDRSIARQAAILGPILEQHPGMSLPMFWIAPAESEPRPLA